MIIESWMLSYMVPLVLLVLVTVGGVFYRIGVGRERARWREFIELQCKMSAEHWDKELVDGERPPKSHRSSHSYRRPAGRW